MSIVQPAQQSCENPPLNERVLIFSKDLSERELVAMRFESKTFQAPRWKVFNYHGAVASVLHRDFVPEYWKPFKIEITAKLPDEKHARKTEALKAIARERRSATGGYLARADMAELARRALLECGETWEHPVGG